MSLFDTLLVRLEALQVELAREALASPQGRDAFEYGRMAGLYAGLDRARTLVKDLISDEEEQDDNL